MTRLIDADKLNDYAYEVYQCNGVELETIMVVPLSAINNAPTVDLKRVKNELNNELNELRPQGEWGKHGECPFCSYIRQWEDDNFCGNCGADMRSDK